MDFTLQDLKESNEFLNLLLENITSVVFIVDGDLKIQRFNSTFDDLFHRPEDEVIDVRCGNALGCAYAVEEKAVCGESSKCGTCNIRRSLLDTFAEKVPVTRELLRREFYIDGERTEKHFVFSTRHVRYDGRTMILLIIDDVTDLEQERAKSEKLLLNVLPARVAEELKAHGVSAPQAFSDVTILFSDMAGFTAQSAKLSPEKLIAELNDVFTAFDTIVEEHGCERIKTIGDAYLAVCGMPEPSEDHAARIARAARDMVNWLDDRNAGSDIKWRVRIGLHSGEAVGAVVGVKKYIYDVFGDTVNTAARMEQHSEPMMVNCSEATHALIADKFEFTERPAIDVKGKGQMKMYMLNA